MKRSELLTAFTWACNIPGMVLLWVGNVTHNNNYNILAVTMFAFAIVFGAASMIVRRKEKSYNRRMDRWVKGDTELFSPSDVVEEKLDKKKDDNTKYQTKISGDYET